MKKYNCPSCAAQVVFQASLSVYAVCRYCSSMVVRRDLDVESIGSMAMLPDDMSPLQLGTGGLYRGRAFSLIGRIKASWENGFWNEWFMMLDDGCNAWLAEAQGFYAVSFLYKEVEAKAASGKKTASPKSERKPKIGSFRQFKDRRYRAVDIKEVRCVGSEGELPFSAPCGRKTTSVDYLGEDGEFACVEIDADEERIYIGHYVDWNELRCTNLRQLEGW
jgi:hypothetical protein